MTTISGIHHVTAIATDPQRTLDFYAGVLGLRLVKKTVNFDDPQTYHFYFGDASGRPGTILTFFPIPRAFQGIRGSGQTTSAGLSIPAGALGWWIQRFDHYGVRYDPPSTHFGETALTFYDPDGLQLELVAVSNPAGDAWDGSPVNAEAQIRGVHHILLNEQRHEPTAALLTETLGFRQTQADGNRYRYEAGDGGPGAIVDILVSPETLPGRVAAGSVHHVAFRTPDDEAQQAWRAQLVDLGYGVSPVMDRSYFHSIYFREPGGVLFEIATDTPGFATDETPDTLGTTLRLPPQFEAMRSVLERRLPPLRLPNESDPEMTDLDFVHVYEPGQRALTLLLLHGTGGDERSLLAMAHDLAPGATLLSPRGKVLEGTQARFFRRLREGVFDEDDIRQRAGELSLFVAAAAKEYGFDPEKVVALGYSNGANMAASLLLLRPGLLAGAVLLRPMVPLRPDPLPDLSGIPVFMAAGQHDELVPVDQVDALADLLRACRADVTLEWEDAGHKLTKAELESARAWIAAQWG